MPGASIHLRQTKMFVGPMRFAVRHEIVSASPALLAFPLIVDASASPKDKERLVAVASLDALVRRSFTDGRALVPKKLNSFADHSVSISARPSDTLIIFDCPTEWGGGTQTFTVRGPDSAGSALIITDAFSWSFPEPEPPNKGLRWELQRAGAVVANGDQGYTMREGGDGLSLSDRFMAILPDGETALNHMTSIATYLDSLAKSAGLDGASFEAFPPGNPVDYSLPDPR
jgi:hypothetical protein